MCMLHIYGHSCKGVNSWGIGQPRHGVRLVGLLLVQTSARRGASFRWVPSTAPGAQRAGGTGLVPVVGLQGVSENECLRT